MLGIVHIAGPILGLETLCARCGAVLPNMSWHQGLPVVQVQKGRTTIWQQIDEMEVLIDPELDYCEP